MVSEQSDPLLPKPLPEPLDIPPTPPAWRRRLPCIVISLLCLTYVIGTVAFQHCGGFRCVGFGVASASPERRYLYMSFHGSRLENATAAQGMNQVYRIDLMLPENVPTPVLSGHDGHREFRGMAHGGDGSLLVASAFRNASSIAQFGPCGERGRRPFVRDYSSPSLVHPYGVALHDGSIYASAQDTGAIVSFPFLAANASTMEGGSVPGAHFWHDPRATLRGVAYASGCIYAADQETDTILRICGREEHSTTFASIKQPIALAVDEHRGWLYVGSRSDSHPGVTSFDVRTGAVVQHYRHSHMRHPAGIVLDEHRLYVVSQHEHGDPRTKSELLEFHVKTGLLMKIVEHHRDLPHDAPEQLLISSC